MTDFCETRVPSEVREALQPIMSDDEAVKDYGVELGIRMCKALTEAGTPGEQACKRASKQPMLPARGKPGEEKRRPGVANDF